MKDAILSQFIEQSLQIKEFRMKRSLLCFVSCHLCLVTYVSAAEKPVNFARQILPILSNKCFVCHGPDSREKDLLKLDSFDAATRDLGGYQAINSEKPEESEILTRLHSTDAPMPPEDAEKQLTSAERELLSRWVREGGKYETHWAFVPPQKTDPPGAPQATDAAAIDAFIEDQLSANGVSFAPAADRSTLARRVALTLTGLPPEPELLNRFLAEQSEDAYDKLVEEFLSSPRYAEHQARYWLDAVRYGDTHGLHLDNRRGIYPYRDWVIRAFNQNLRLDQFITWQLAGDLLENPTLEQLVATGFVRMNPTTAEGGAIPEEFQAKNNFDRVETFGTVFLGMSLTCARCHSHKYDPISQTEYYRLLAFFNSTAEHSMDGNKYDYAPVISAPASLSAWDEWNKLEAARAKLIDKASQLLSQKKDSFPAWESATADEKFALLLKDDGPVQNEELQSKTRVLDTKLKQLQEGFTTTLVAKELDTPRPTHLLERGEYHLPTGDSLQPGTFKIMGSFPKNAPANRLGLAQWLTSPGHPLVARVLVNQLWQRVFGVGLVRTPEDFGLQGEQPTHPELLDWLAVELQQSGWDLKHMLRLMVTTKAFRQSSRWRDDVNDPENRLFSRGPSYRLDAEVLRDLTLWSSDLLDPYMGGEGVKPYQPAGLWSALMHPASNTKKYEADQGDRLYRRSLYVYWKRTSPHPMMTLFDAPSRETSCIRRSRTNTSLQSLGLLNETQRIEAARRLAARLLASEQDNSKRLDMLFSLLTCRTPTAEERNACEQLLTQMLKRYQSASEDASALLSIGDAPRNNDLNAAEHAAWTQVASTVLASDLTIMLY